MTFEEYHQLEFLDSEPIPDWFGWWFAGFVDGEGCFKIKPNSPRRTSFMMCLAIQLRDDDTPLLEYIREILHIGHLHHYSNANARDGLTKYKRNCQDVSTWRVYRIVHLVRYIVPLFDRYSLQSKKKRDYDIWRQAVSLSWRLHTNPRKPKWYIDRMRELKQELENVRKYENGGGTSE